MTDGVREKLFLPSEHVLRRTGQRALGLGLVALVVLVIGALFDRERALQGYLVTYLFWVGLPIGGLAILMLQHITGGAWGAVIRRILEALVATFPLMAVLFVPIALSLPELYAWADADVVAHDPILQHKTPYLNESFFVTRAAVYFGLWVVLSFFLARWSRMRDRPDPPSQRRLENLSRGGLLVLAMTGTFASIDWAMSLEPHWFSTIYGILFLGGQVLAALAFSIAIAASLSDAPLLSSSFTPDRFHDLGKLLLAFVMVWAYFALSQFLIIWSGNLPEETPWYFRRLHGGWQWMGVSLIVLHFAVPFALLLSRPLKRRAGALAAVALGVLTMRVVDVYWLVAPSFGSDHFTVSWIDFAALLAIGGIWFAFFVSRLVRQPLLPLSDPDLPELAEVAS